MNSSSSYTLFFDGCSKGNPGLAGSGAVIYNHLNKEIWYKSSFVGKKETNNVAEYSGLILGLEEALYNNKEIRNLIIKGDSKLVIEQMKGNYKVNSQNLLQLYKKAKELIQLGNFENIDFIHVYRNENKRADELSNLGLNFYPPTIYFNDNLLGSNL